MAGKKGAKPPAPKKTKTPKTAKVPKTPKTAGGDSGIGHNSRIPPITELKPFFSRLDKLVEQMASKRGEFMLDIKAVRHEAAGGLGVSRAVFNVYYNKYRAEVKFAKDLDDLEAKAQDDMDRLVAAGQNFGPESPFGAWCIAQGGLREGANAKTHNEVKPPPSKLIPANDPPPVDPAARGREGFSVGLGDGDEADDKPH